MALYTDVSGAAVEVYGATGSGDVYAGAYGVAGWAEVSVAGADVSVYGVRARLVCSCGEAARACAGCVVGGAGVFLECAYYGM